MARKQEFRRDRETGGGFARLLLTKQQRLRLAKWGLLGVLCLLALLLQDTVLYRVQLLGAGTDMVPCVIFAIALQLDLQSGSLFCLITSLLYYCSGSAPGPHVIVLITGISVFLVIFRQGYLQQGFLAVLLSTAVGMLSYELCVFLAGVITGDTMLSRLGMPVLTALWSLVAVPLVYPAVRAIDKQGGDLWRE